MAAGRNLRLKPWLPKRLRQDTIHTISFAIVERARTLGTQFLLMERYETILRLEDKVLDLL